MKFWMVLGSGEPVFRHATRRLAEEEAERLARLNPGQTFVLLESVAEVTVRNTIWTSHLANLSAGIPF